MANGSFNLTRTGSTSSYVNFLVTWSSQSNGSIANSSILNVAVYVTKSSGSTSNTWGTVNTSVSVTDAGTQYENGLALNVAPNSSQLVFAKNFTVPHNSDGKKTATISVNVGGNVVWGNGSENIILDTIPRQATVTSANNFNDEENPSLTFSNPAGFKIDAYLEVSGMETIMRENIINTGSYTFVLTEEERNRLRVRSSNSNTLGVRYVIQTTIESTKYWTWLDRTMTIINANPIFNDFEFADINEKTIELTGNNQNIILGYSNIKVNIPETKKAISQKEATMSKYRFNNNEANYSETNDISIISNNVTSGEFTVYAIDSRNNSTLKIKSASSVIVYDPLIRGNINAKRENGVSENVILELDGKIDLVNFGAKVNSIVSAQYRYKIASEDNWSEFENITINVEENGNFTFNGLIKGDTETLGFNIENAYNIEVYIKDELSEIKYIANFGAGIPHIAYAKKGIGIMGKYDEQVGGLLQVAGKRIDNNYTTEEQLIGTWVNGEHLYRRVLLGILPELDGGWQNVVQIDSGLVIRKMIGTLGYIAFPVWLSNDYYLGMQYFQNGSIQVLGKGFDENQFNIIIEYTKTTD